jgi:hypothetical protein
VHETQGKGSPLHQKTTNKLDLEVIHDTFQQLTQGKHQTVKFEDLFSPEVKQMISSLLTPYFRARYDSVSLSKQNYNNFLLNYWISLSLSIPILTLFSREQTLCLKCTKRNCMNVKQKMSTVLHKISKCRLTSQALYFCSTPKGKKYNKGNQSLRGSDVKQKFLNEFNHPGFFKKQVHSNKSIETELKEGVKEMQKKIHEIDKLEEELKKLEEESDQVTMVSYKSERPIFNLELDGKRTQTKKKNKSVQKNLGGLSQSFHNFYNNDFSVDRKTNRGNNSMMSVGQEIGLNGKLLQHDHFYNSLMHNGPTMFENSVNGTFFHPPSRISNLEKEDFSVFKKAENIFEKEKNHLVKFIAKLSLIPCGSCLGKLQIPHLNVTSKFKGKFQIDFKRAKRLTKQNLAKTEKRYKAYSSAHGQSIYANAGLCRELQKRHLFGSLLQLEDKLIAESLGELKAITEFGQVLVEFKGSHLVYPFSLNQLLRLDTLRTKSLFKVHWSKMFRKPYSFSSSFNKMNSWEQVPEGLELGVFPNSILLLKTFHCKPLWKKWQHEFSKRDNFQEFEFSQFCLNLRNYSRFVEKRDTLHNVKQTRKSKVKNYKGVCTQKMHLAESAKVQKVVFTCHHCSYRGPRSHFLECYQKNFFSRLNPNEELLKVFLNIKSNIHMFCEKVYCKECIKNFYPESDSKENDFKNWICPFCREKCYCSLCNNRDLYFKMHDLFLSLGGNSDLLKEKSPVQKIVSFYLTNPFYDMKFCMEGFKVLTQINFNGDSSLQMNDFLKNQESKFSLISQEKTFNKKPNKKVVSSVLYKKPKFAVTQKFQMTTFKKTSHIFIVIKNKNKKFRKKTKKNKTVNHSYQYEVKQFFKKVGGSIIWNFRHLTIMIPPKFSPSRLQTTSCSLLSIPQVHVKSMAWKTGLSSLLVHHDAFHKSVRFRKFILSEHEREYKRQVEATQEVVFPLPVFSTPRKKLKLLFKVKNQMIDLFELLQLVKKREIAKLDLFQENLKN